MHVQTDESRGGLCFPHLYRKNQRQLRNSTRLKRFSDRKGEERKQAYSAPRLLTTTCICPPVVSKIAHKKSRYPGGIKTDPKIIFEKLRLWKIFSQRHLEQMCKHTDLSLSYRLTCLHHERILLQIHTVNQNAAKFRSAKLNILTLDDQTRIQ